ncbi:MAG TPA: hydantoinase B/oxoprolinase family protein, partial [Phycisphaerales bacterium]|nr:hydantoinase B/oxoprolinase family protein [Phycisphaerales bacterium]
MPVAVNRIASATNTTPDPDALLDGFLDIVNERMAGAIESISLRKGYDPTDHALVSFGGAGGQHACAVASMLGMKTIIMPPDASLLSAVGLGSATIERFARKQTLLLLDDSFDELHELFDACEAEVTSEICGEGVPHADIGIRRRLAYLRLAGQDATIAVEIATDLCASAMRAQFEKRYADLYGHAPENRPIEVESIGVLAAARRKFADTPTALAATSHQVPPDRTTRVRLNGAWADVPVHHRSNLKPGAQLNGPSLIFDRRSSYVLESGWSAQIDAAGAIVATRSVHVAPTASAKLPAVVRLELFTNRFASIAEDMGHVLQRASMSTNIKRRLDFSCAVLDASGELVVNAPHIPVHLGALGMCVRAVAQQLDIRPGDVIITNHPAFGGSHLPDITVITPVHMADGTLIGYVANRAHHAEIGGTRPGSMPPLAKTLAEEGVVIPPMHLLRHNERGHPQSRLDAIEQLLREARYPSRAVDENLADLRAAMACNTRGAASLLALAEAHGYHEVDAQMKSIKARAAKLAAEALTSLGDHETLAEEVLDDGSIIRVRFAVLAGRATIDFTGTSPRHPGNLNATPAIVRSAVLYVLRLLIGERLPLNEGIMQAVEIVLPTCLLNPDFEGDPSRAPAVVGGNTETSQRLVDTLLKALGAAACSQGTMN